MDPGVIPCRVTEARQTSPRFDERVLHAVPRRLRPAGHEAGNPVQAADISGGQLPEGVVVSAPGAFDEISPVHRFLEFLSSVL
jgi:hypothetical protein